MPACYFQKKSWKRILKIWSGCFLRKKVLEIKEGAFHDGLSSVIRLVAKR